MMATHQDFINELIRLRGSLEAVIIAAGRNEWREISLGQCETRQKWVDGMRKRICEARLAIETGDM